MKLEPLMLTSVPAGPDVIVSGFRVALAVTLNVAVTVPAPAVTVMVWAPAVAPAGTVMTLRNSPPLVVWVWPLFGVIVVVSNLNTSAVLAGKLAPETVISVPAGPVAGESGSRVAAAVIVKAGDFPNRVGKTVSVFGGAINTLVMVT